MKQPDLNRKRPRDKTDQISQKSDLTTEPFSGTHLGKVHVLIVDDDMDAMRALAEILESEGFEIACAGNGQEAWEQMHRRRPDLIVLDSADAENGRQDSTHASAPRPESWQLSR